jgi:hypothetical protein
MRRAVAGNPRQPRARARLTVNEPAELHIIRQNQIVQVGAVTLELVGLLHRVQRNTNVLALDVTDGQRLRASPHRHAHVRRATVRAVTGLVRRHNSTAQTLQQRLQRRAVTVLGGVALAANVADVAKIRA